MFPPHSHAFFFFADGPGALAAFLLLGELPPPPSLMDPDPQLKDFIEQEVTDTANIGKWKILHFSYRHGPWSLAPGSLANADWKLPWTSTQLWRWGSPTVTLLAWLPPCDFSIQIRTSHSLCWRLSPGFPELRASSGLLYLGLQVLCNLGFALLASSLPLSSSAWAAA